MSYVNWSWTDQGKCVGCSPPVAHSVTLAYTSTVSLQPCWVPIQQETWFWLMLLGVDAGSHDTLA